MLWEVYSRLSQGINFRKKTLMHLNFNYLALIKQHIFQQRPSNSEQNKQYIISLYIKQWGMSSSFFSRLQMNYIWIKLDKETFNNVNIVLFWYTKMLYTILNGSLLLWQQTSEDMFGSQFHVFLSIIYPGTALTNIMQKFSGLATTKCFTKLPFTNGCTIAEKIWFTLLHNATS